MAYDAGRVEVGVGAKLDRASWQKVDAQVKKASQQKAEVTVAFKLDRRQLDRAYQLLRKWRTERADAKLGFTILRGQYNEHLRMVRTAGRREAKASLGFKIDRANLRQFEAQVAHAIRRVSRDLTVDVKLRVDEQSARATSALRDNERQVDRNVQVLRGLGGATSFVGKQFASMGQAVGRLSVSMGPLSGRLAYFSNAAVALIPILASLAGVMVALGSSFASAAAGAAAAGGAIGSALVPAGILGIGVMTRLTEAMDVFALREKAVEATATDVTAATNDQVRSADQLADSFDGVQGALESLQDSYDAVTDAQQQVVRATRDYRQAVRQARSDVREAADAEQDAARDVVDAQKEVTRARQEALAVAREANAEARRSALDARDAELSLAEARDEQGAAYRRILDLQQLPLEEGESAAQRTEAVSDAQRDYQQAQQGVRRAELDLQDARKRQNDALKETTKFVAEGTKAYEPLREAIERVKEAEDEHAKTVKELNRLRRRDVNDVPAVIAALEGIRDANEGLERSLRNVERAHRAVASARRQRATVTEAQEEVPEVPLSQIRRAQYGFEQLTEAEQDFVLGLEHLRDSFKRDLQPATDTFFRTFTHGMERAEGLLDDLKDPLNDLGRVLAGELRDTIDMLTGKQWTDFFEASTEFAKDLAPPVADVLRDFANIFRLFAEAAQGETVRLLEDLAEVTGDWVAQLERDPKGLRRAVHEMFEDFRSWVALLESIADLLITVVGISAPEGKDTIDGLTTAIEDFDKELEGNEQMREDFVDWIRDSKDFFTTLYTILSPTVDAFADLARWGQEAVNGLGGLFGMKNAGKTFFDVIGHGIAVLMVGRITRLNKVIPALLKRLFLGKAATAAIEEGASGAGGAAAGSFTTRLRTRLSNGWSRVRSLLGRLFGRTAENVGTNAGAAAADNMITGVGKESRKPSQTRRLSRIGRAMGALIGIAMVAGLVFMFKDELAKATKDLLEHAKDLGDKLADAAGGAFEFVKQPFVKDDRGDRPEGVSKEQWNEWLREVEEEGGAKGGLITRGGIVRGFQRGGLVPKGEDTLVGVQFGEFIMRREAVDRAGVGAMEAINRGETETGLAETLKKEAQEAGTPLKTIGEMLGVLAVEGKVAGAEAGEGISTGLKDGGEEAVETTEQTTRDVTKSWEDLADDTGDAVSDMNRQVERRFDDIHDTATDKSRDLKRSVSKQFEDTEEAVDDSMRSIARKTENRMEDAADKGTKASRKLRDNVSSTMESLDRVVFQGMSYVGEATNKALMAFDEKKVDLNIPKPKELRRQGGGWTGPMGARGEDSLMAAVAPGEGVITGWHQGPLNQLMAVGQELGISPWGSVDEMFQRERRPHALAGNFQAGGIVGIPGMQGEYIHSSIKDDVVKMIRAYKLFITDGYAPEGHEPLGEHPLGLAIDAVPAEGVPGASWSLIGKGMTESGYPNPPNAPFRWLGWLNEPDHGPPGGPTNPAFPHGHWSWEHGSSGFNPRGVDTELPKLKVKGPDGAPKTIAQKAVNTVRKAADAFINDKAFESMGSVMHGTIPPGAVGNARTIFNFFTSAGFRDVVAAGITGTLHKETGGTFSTTIPNAIGSGAFGLAQWLGGRLDTLKTRPNWTSLQTQLNFILWELNGGDSIAHASLGALKAAGSPTAAAIIFDQTFERSDDIGNAAAMAEAYYRQFGNRTRNAQRGGKMGEHGFARGGKLSVAHVGDSIAVGTRSPGGLAGKLKKIGVHGKTKGGISAATALGYLRSTLRDGDDAIVFDAGTNDTSAGTVRSALTSVLKLADDRPVIVPATRGTAQAEKNKMLANARGIEYMPWKVSMGDSVHPSVPTGYNQRARMLAKLIGRVVSPGTSEGEDGEGGGFTGKKSPGGKKLIRFWDLDFDAQEFFGIKDRPEGFQRGGLRGGTRFNLSGRTHRPPADDVLRQGAAAPPKRGRFVAGKLLPGKADRLVANVSDQVEGEEEVGGNTWQQVLSNLERRTKTPRQNFEQAKVDISGLDSRITVETTLADRTEEDFVLAPGDPGFDAQTSAAIHTQLGTPGADSGTLPYVDQAAVDRRTAELTKIGKLYFKQAKIYRTLELAIVRLVKLTRGARTRLRQLRGKAKQKKTIEKFNTLIGGFGTELEQLRGTTYNVRAERAGQFLDYQGIQRELAELAPGAQAELTELLTAPGETPDVPEDDLGPARLASLEALNEALRGRDLSQAAFIRSITSSGDVAQGGFQNAFGAVATPYAGAALSQQQVPGFGGGVGGAGMGSPTVVVNQTNQMLTPSDPAVLRGVASATVSGLGLQPFRPSTRESWRI